MKRLVVALILSVSLSVASLGFFKRTTAAASSYRNSAQSLAVIERDSGRILAASNADEKLPMASTTKIVTAITVIEKEDELDRVISIPASAVGIEGSSIYLQAGERLSLRQLLYGLMLRSGNDCAVALALSVSGSIEAFADEMNRTALKAGAADSNFVNPHGLHDKKHYTTARDLAIISAYAMKNATFREIVSTKRIVIPWQGHDCDRELINKNKILSTLEGGDGIKTGYTSTAGRCLVASATRNGMNVIAVVLNCVPMFESCRELIDQAFTDYRNIDISEKIEDEVFARVNNGKQKYVGLSVNEPIFYPLANNEESELKIETEGIVAMNAPVKKGKQNGKIKIYLKNRLLFEKKLYTIDKVNALSIGDMLAEIFDESVD